MKKITSLFLLLVFAMAGHAKSEPRDVSSIRSEPCSLAGVDPKVRCGSLQVWENRHTRRGRKIAIHFLVFPAVHRATSDPLVYIAGGPGASSIDDATSWAEQFRELRDTRDILFVDMRGSGRSHPLNCDVWGPELRGYMGDYLPAARVQRCADELSAQADLRQYTTDNSVDDLDDVRAALGYDRLNLLGTSYGTRYALAYLRRHPGHSRTAILQAVVPTDLKTPYTYAADAERALDGVLAECDRDPPCRAAFPQIRNDLDAALAKLAKGSVEVTIRHPETGEALTVPLSRDLFAEAVRGMLYQPSSASGIPTLLHQAAGGDFAPAAEWALVNSRYHLAKGASLGLYLSITCAEDVPFFPEQEGIRRAKGSFLGASRVVPQKAACRVWPSRPVSRSFLKPVVSDAPVLMVTGQWDPVTPPRTSAEALVTLKNATRLIVPSGGHDFGGVPGAWECITPIMIQAIRSGSAKSLDTSCVNALERGHFPVAALPSAWSNAPTEDVRPYVGAFEAPGAKFIETKLIDARLHLMLDGQDLLLAPISPARFAIIGWPFQYVEFARVRGAVTALIWQPLGEPTMAYARRK
ncbi:MAG: alpha/beta hydrolase [Luteimonas sp.]